MTLEAVNRSIRTGTIHGLIDGNGEPTDHEWLGFSARDSLNQSLAGEEVLDQGLGRQPVVKDHDVADEQGSPVEAPFDVTAHYIEIWNG